MMKDSNKSFSWSDEDMQYLMTVTKVNKYDIVA